jgi:hypothetical protein
MRRLITTAVLAVTAVLAMAATAQADIRVQSVRSFDGVEGEAANGGRIVSFDDVGNCSADAYSVTIAWGDGTTSPGNITFSQPRPSLPGAPDPGASRCIYEASASHTYRTSGSYGLSATVCRAAECVVSGGGGIAALREADLRGEAQALSTAAGLTFAGQVAEFNDDNRLATAADYSGAIIDWGDGTTSPGTVTCDNGRFEGSGTHVYTAPGTYLLRVTLMQRGVARVIADTATVSVGGAATPAPPLVTAQSTTRARPTLRMRTSTIRRRSLAAGLPIRITAPSSIASLRVTLVRITGTRVRTLGRVTVALRGGRVTDGVRTANLRVRLPRALRNRIRAGSYGLRFRIGDSGLISAQFRVR